MKNTNNIQQHTTLNNNKNSLRNKIWYGIKSGWDLPTLPDHIIKLNKRIPLRLLRFIGPVSMFTIVSGIGRQFNNSFIYYTIVVISLLYIFYKYLIIYYTIKQWFHHLFNGDFIVRNSPMEILGTILRGSASSLKTAGSFTIGTGITYALCHELDDILESEGKERYFVPTMNKGLKQIGLYSVAGTFLTKIGIKNAAPVEYIQTYHEYIKNMNDVEKAAFLKYTGVSHEDAVKTINFLEENRGKELGSSIHKYLEKEDPFGTKKK